MDEEITRCRNQTFLVEAYLHQNKPGYTPPDLAYLEELLNQNKFTAFLEEVTQYLKVMLNNRTLETSVL